jgi:hypothetical protein
MENTPIRSVTIHSQSLTHRGIKDTMTILTTVAVILERERDSVVKEWLRRANSDLVLSSIPLSDVERTHHLFTLLDDVVSRLGDPDRVATPSGCTGAAMHGRLRFVQGYSVSMLVEESRLFEVSAFMTLHLHRRELIKSDVLLGVMTIADEADKQLEESVQAFTIAA